ncbi:ABC transporter ATP-binding protein [Bradyrhizobium mercantei]|uniref:ABC transporter ATP-binding protein n=1 Tax=Bradyrhizobium mercantei TaxID=1904807 RepID=UPI001177D258|nr:ABC transporter ATP-binding protein [Bradyrhizobium mercantei]
MISSILQIRCLSKRFGGTHAVREISADLQRGQIYGLIGPNGSGKTTLINLISGFYAPDTGEIILDGEELTRRKPYELAGLGLVRTFQMPKTFASLTVLENVLLPVAGDGRSESLDAMRDAAFDALATTGLTGMAQHPAGSLSGGQAMLLQLARALMCAPVKLLLLDEPFGGVAPALKERITHTIRQINERFQATVVLVSHEMSTIRALCSNVIVMGNGQVIAQGTLDEVSASPEVVAAYLGKPV